MECIRWFVGNMAGGRYIGIVGDRIGLVEVPYLGVEVESKECEGVEQFTLTHRSRPALTIQPSPPVTSFPGS